MAAINKPLSSHKLLLVMATALFLTRCGEVSEQEPFTLPISINEVMASLINHSADPIWVAAWQNPQSDHDWRELEHLARQLEVGGSLITIPGTGPVDAMWVGRREWRKHATALSNAAGRAVNAARSRDVELIQRSGDEIVDACEACHIDFKPDLPTMNIYGELPARPEG